MEFEYYGKLKFFKLEYPKVVNPYIFMKQQEIDIYIYIYISINSDIWLFWQKIIGNNNNPLFTTK